MKTFSDVEAYWDSRPCNLFHSPEPPGSAKYFLEVRERKAFVEPHIKEFAQFWNWREKRILEIGCGLGCAAVEFAMQGAASVVAVDLSRESLELALQHAEWLMVSDKILFLHCNVETDVAEFFSIPKYDLVYSWGVLHHTPDPGRALRNLRKVIDDSGTLKIMLYHRWSTKGLRVMLGARSEAAAGCPITYLYSKDEARRLVESAGFRVESIEVDHVFPWSVRAYKEYRYVKSWVYRWMPERLFRWIERHWGWHLMITAKPV